MEIYNRSFDRNSLRSCRGTDRLPKRRCALDATCSRDGRNFRAKLHGDLTISRALDYQTAFEQLRKEKTAGKVYFQLTDGSSIANIIDMNIMPNSTLIVFRFNSSQGVRFQVVKVEDILNIYY